PQVPPLRPGETNWAGYNKPFGTLAPDSPSFTEYMKQKTQDALLAMSQKPNPSMTRNVAEARVTGAGFTPMGTILSAGDVIHDIGQGHYVRAGIDALGAIPGYGQVRRLVQRARGQLPMMRMADTPTRTVDPVTGAVQDELLTSARGHYQAVATAPIDFHPGAMPNFTDAARSALQLPQFGSFTPEAARGVHDLLARWKADF